LPSKNEIWSAKVAHLVHHAAQYGTVTDAVATDMASLRLHWPEYLMETGSPRVLLLSPQRGNGG
jgi:hypothetical protein